MRKGEIQVGGFYTKNEPKPLFAREVIDDDGINFIYRDYSLSNGSPISTRSQFLICYMGRQGMYRARKGHLQQGTDGGEGEGTKTRSA